MQLAGLPALFCEVAEANFVALWRGLSDTANDHTEPDIGNTMVGHGDHSRHRWEHLSTVFIPQNPSDSIFKPT
jgi:hypothetical protein